MQALRLLTIRFGAALALCACAAIAGAQTTVRRPFAGITHITRSDTAPRPLRMDVVSIDLTAPGIRFKVTPPGGPRETIRQTTLQFLEAERAQVAINAHFFLPFPSANPFSSLIGLAASDGVIYSAFEAPEQSFAIVTNAPALNLDAKNRAAIVTTSTRTSLWNAVAGSALIITNGVKTIPSYGDGLRDGAGYSLARSWYDQLNARTVIGLANRGRTLILFTVDRADGSLGMSVGEVADLLIRDYKVEQALNLDGGGSTTLAMEDPVTGTRSIVNAPSDNPAGRAVGSSLAVFASRRP